MQNLILNQLPCFSTYGVREQLNFLFSRHCCCSVTKSCPTLCYSMHSGLPWPSLSPTICSNSCPLNQWCYPTTSSYHSFSSCPQSFPASVFSISPFSEYWGLISSRIDCFDLLAVQGTLKSLLQHHSLKASVLWCSAERPFVLQNVSWLSQH